MPPISTYLQEHGPSLSSEVVTFLKNDEGLTPEAARKRVSRLRPPWRRFPVPIFPKGEAFLYHEDQRAREQFWLRLHQALRDSGSTYGAAIDGLLARAGIVLEDEFPVVSGAPTSRQTGHVVAATLLERLIEAGAVKRTANANGSTCVEIARNELCFPDTERMDARYRAEQILLDAIREWARRLGLASYNKIAIRGEPERVNICGYLFDLGGPSYILPFQRSRQSPGFFVADVLLDTTLDEHAIDYFVRKARGINGMPSSNGIFPLLVGQRVTGEALTHARRHGILLTTPSLLFGKRVGTSLMSLVDTLNNAAAYASSSPDRLAKLVDDLSEIEGAAGNLRGTLFELLAAYLARRDAVSIDMGRKALDPQSGKTVDIDVLKITHQGSDCTAIECKGKRPGGLVEVGEVQKWIQRLPTITQYLRNQTQFREAKLSFEIWTSGDFSQDALSCLEEESKKRSRHPIHWKNGNAILNMARQGKEKSIANALEEHFIKHPLHDLSS